MLFKTKWTSILPLVIPTARLSLATSNLQQPLLDRLSFQSAPGLASINMTRGSVIALSHGGGPLPLLGDPNHEDIVESLKNKVPKILKLGTPEAPRAILLVTAHWSEKRPTISNGKKHRLEYDYYGFPPETYDLRYDAPGSPEVAEEVQHAMKKAGLNPELDDFRGRWHVHRSYALTTAVINDHTRI